MDNPQIIIVCGAPATGKTTLAQYAADHFHLPLLHRDGLKETLFQTLGWSNRAWSKKLGGASWDLLFYLMEVQLKARCSFIVESNFDRHLHLARFEAWQAAYPFEVVQIFCKADIEVLYERFHARATSGERHPGHVDHLPSRDEFITLHSGRDYSPLALGGKVIEVDTTDFQMVNYETILAEINI